jgi:ribonuclease HI
MKLEHLRNAVSTEKPDIVCITETHKSNEKFFTTMKLAGYASYHRERKTTQTTKGGVGIYVRTADSLPHKEIHQSPENSLVESLSVQIGQDMIVTAVYKPPGDDKTSEEDWYALKPPIPEDSKWIVVGDFNAHHVIWDSKAKPDSDGETLIEFMIEEGLTILNDPDKPTRRARNLNRIVESSPDLAACRNLQLKWTVEEDAISDHFMMKLQTLEEHLTREKSTRKYWALKKANWNLFTAEMQSSLSNHGTKPCNWKQLKKFILAAAKKAIPKGSHEAFEPLWTEEMHLLEREINTLTKQAVQDPTKLEDIRTKKEELKATFNSLKSDAFQERIKTMTPSNPKSWAFIRNRGEIKPDMEGRIIQDGDSILMTNYEKAEALIRRFADTSKAEVKERRQKIIIAEQENPQPFTQEELRTAMKQMRRGSAPGQDEIPIEMLSHIGPRGEMKILDIMNKSLETGTLPKEWKSGTIIPLLKPGKPASYLASYRPVTLTTHISKVAERMIANRLAFRLKGKLSEDQHGFKKGKSTTTALMEVTDHIAKALNEYIEEDVVSATGKHRKDVVGHRAIAIMIDFSSAFDTIDHKMICEELERLGIPPHERRWIRNFLTGRETRVRCGEHLSDKRVFEAGVPQGTVLGPALFNIAMDSLLRRLQAIPGIKAIAYADDLTILTKGTTVTSMIPTLQAALNAVEEWTKLSKMKVNTSKTEAMLFSHATGSHRDKYTGQPLTYKGLPIKLHLRDSDARTKLLGVSLDNALSMRFQKQAIMEKTSKAMTQLMVLAGTKIGARTDTLRIFAQGYATAKMLYAAEIWYPLISADTKDKLEGKYRRLMRLVCGACNTAEQMGVYLESSTIPLYLQIRQTQLRTVESYLRSASGNTLTPPVKAKNQRGDVFFQTPFGAMLLETEKLEAWLGTSIRNREELMHISPIAPWETEEARRIHIFPTVTDKKKENLTEHTRRVLSEVALRRHGSRDIEIWTDGSVKQDDGTSGSAYIIHSMTDGSTVTGMIPSGAFACSFTAERNAIDRALIALVQDTPTKLDHVVIATDSQSLLLNLQRGPISQNDKVIHRIWGNMLHLAKTRQTRFTLQHVFSHCGIEMNEQVDKLADQANTLPQDEAPIALRDIKAAIRRYTLASWKSHVANVDPQTSYRIRHYGSLPTKPDTQLTRRREVLQTRIRTGFVPGLATYMRKLDPKMAESCRLCTPADHVPVGGGNLYQGMYRDSQQCPHCTRTLHRRDRLLEHIRNFHPEHGIPMKYKCEEPQCTFETGQLNLLKNHLETNHGKKWQRPEVTRNPSTGPEETLMHLIWECPMTESLRTKYELQTKEQEERALAQYSRATMQKVENIVVEILRYLEPP